MKIIIALSIACLLLLNANGQRPSYVFQGYVGSDDTLNPKKLYKWEAQKLSAYNGVYDFGESEGEWELLVIATDSGLVLQSFHFEWGKVDNIEGYTFRKRVRVYRNVKVSSNKFISDSLTGFFMTYNTSELKRNGIILLKNPAKIDTVEFGRKYDSLDKFWFFKKGDYGELSYELPDTSYFRSRSKEQLFFMRNEIYARYGQRFAKGGKAYAYFSKKGWYAPFRDNVQMCLTEIEFRNIALIKYFERSN
jgi:hypothetical protein